MLVIYVIFLNVPARLQPEVPQKCVGFTERLTFLHNITQPASERTGLSLEKLRVTVKPNLTQEIQSRCLLLQSRYCNKEN